MKLTGYRFETISILYRVFGDQNGNRVAKEIRNRATFLRGVIFIDSIFNLDLILRF